MVQDIFPNDAWNMLIGTQNSYLVDVRTSSEWNDAKPDLSAINGRLIMLEWKQLPGMSVNPVFAKKIAEIITKSDILLFLCKSGVRSHEAAQLMSACGYKYCYNIKHGFCDGTTFSWQFLGLPWS